MEEFGQRTLDARVAGEPLRVNRTLITLGDRRELVYYWFQQRGRVITDEFAVKCICSGRIDASSNGRRAGAIDCADPPGGDRAAADRELADFAARIAPSLPRYVPTERGTRACAP